MVKTPHFECTNVGAMGLIPKWQPTPVFLPGKSHGWRSLVGYSPWGCKESDMAERLYFLLSFLGNRNTHTHTHTHTHTIVFKMHQ